MTRQQIHQIVQDAITAPSGDNCQPFSFEWNGSTLSIIHHRERANHPLNPGQMASLVALGCLLEALSIASTAQRCSAQIELVSPGSAENSLWAKVQFKKGSIEPDPLYAFLHKRTTDRRPYQGGELNESLLQNILDRQNQYEPVRIHFLNQISQEFMKYILDSEVQMFAHPLVLPHVLKWTHLSVRKARESGDGLSWKNMEMKLFELPTVPLIRKFPISLKLFRGELIRQHRGRISRQVKSAAGLICVTVPREKTGPQEILQAARMIMRTWLALAQQGYGCQPLTMSSSLILFKNKNLLDNHFQNHLDLYERGERLLEKAFSYSSDRLPVWMIRTGRSSDLPMEVRTFRRPVEQILKILS